MVDSLTCASGFPISKQIPNQNFKTTKTSYEPYTKYYITNILNTDYMITFHIITLFPDILKDYANGSILGRAQKNKKINIVFTNPRDFAKDTHKKADDKAYGGGPGMVMKAEPILKAVQKDIGNKKAKSIILAADGKQFTNGYAQKLSKEQKNIVLIAGHYEGIDERVRKILKAEKISVGPYIVTGGELPAMMIVDAVARQVPGVLGKEESIEEKRIASGEVYTRPETFAFKKKKYRVPKVLLSGDHKKIIAWQKAHRRTPRPYI